MLRFWNFQEYVTSRLREGEIKKEVQTCTGEGVGIAMKTQVITNIVATLQVQWEEIKKTRSSRYFNLTFSSYKQFQFNLNHIQLNYI